MHDIDLEKIGFFRNGKYPLLFYRDAGIKKRLKVGSSIELGNGGTVELVEVNLIEQSLVFHSWSKTKRAHKHCIWLRGSDD